MWLFEQYVNKDPQPTETKETPKTETKDTTTETKETTTDGTKTTEATESKTSLSDLFGNFFNTSSTSSDWVTYPARMLYKNYYNYNNSRYVKDFTLKNYNGYSNRSYSNKYPAAYRDYVRAVAAYDYRQKPGKAYSARAVRELRDPNAKGLPGGSFSKKSWFVKPYRVGDKTK